MLRNVLMPATVVRVTVVARKTRTKKRDKGGGSDGGRGYDSFARRYRLYLAPVVVGLDQ
jgi:hypothetical protein